MSDMERATSKDVIDLNIQDLDVEQLEQRLELAAAHLDDAWDECGSCGQLITCGTYSGNECPSFSVCGTYTDCKPQE